MLRIVDVHTFYGESHILHGISLEINPGSVTAILGRNGMGKTTLMRSIIGFTPVRYGEIWFKEKEISRLPSYKIAQMGLGLVPQGRRIFPSLSVKENLTVGQKPMMSSHSWSLERVYSSFPILEERANVRGTLLSGGEQQMLCIARALLTNPEFLLMDEPSEGLSPLFVMRVGEIISELKKEGLSILLAEQNLSLAVEVSDYVCIISKGELVYKSTPQDLLSNEEIMLKHLAIKT
ncbi:MAG: ABC transporter ATP-binding protein [Dehalococcoidales bacterium]|nr:ABC transporter ATP-binding protein [Dehalococcoidales bacterium]